MTQPLRVLRLIARLNVGGPAINAALLTARLEHDRFDTVLAAGTPGDREGDMLELRPELRAAIGDRVVRIPGLGRDVRGIGDVRATASVAALVRRVRPHILHTHTAKAGAIGRVVGAALRVPVMVHTFHGTVFGGHFSPGVANAIVTAERALARVSDALIAVSPAVADDLRVHRIGDRSGPVRVIPLGLDLAPLLAVAPLAADAPPTITLVARAVAVKDIPLFLSAASLARDVLPDLRIRVAGDGPLLPSLQSSNTVSGVEFLGFRGDIDELLRSTTAVALSSRSEGSPVALIESLAAGRPVAAVPVGGVTDVLRGRAGAVLAPDRSANALADAIVAAVRDPDVRRGAQQGRGAIARDYGADRLVADISSLYDELWAARRR